MQRRTFLTVLGTVFGAGFVTRLLPSDVRPLRATSYLHKVWAEHIRRNGRPPRDIWTSVELFETFEGELVHFTRKQPTAVTSYPTLRFKSAVVHKTSTPKGWGVVAY